MQEYNERIDNHRNQNTEVNMNKKILSVILSILFILSAITPALAAEVPEAVEPSEIIEASEAEAAILPKAESDLAQTGAEDPMITSVTPSQNGLTLRWSAFDSAALYAVFMRRPDNSGWKLIGRTAETSFEHKGLTNNTTYTYTVRATDSNGAFVSDFDREGVSFTYLDTPKLMGVSSINGGQRVSWSPVEGAGIYSVYVMYPDGWKPVYHTTATTFLNKNVSSGKLYRYTVRCRDSEGKVLMSYFDRKGISGVYVEAPQITGFAPINGGIAVSWNAVPGAAKYGVFMKSNGKWKGLGVTDKTTYNHLKLTDKTTYTYTVRCIDKNGAFCSGYNTVGSDYRYVAPPRISSVTADGKLTWNSIAGVSGYRVYRKIFGKSWEIAGSSDANTFTDTNIPKNHLYTYTVRCLDENGKACSHFYSDEVYYLNSVPANRTFNIAGNPYRFVNGKLIRQGYTKIDGKLYYFNSAGVMQKNGLVGNSKDGWRYADKNGVINLNYTGLATNSAGTWYLKKGTLDRTLRTAVTVNGVDYNILNGRAYKVSTTKDRTLFRALKIVTKVTDNSMSKSEKLKAVWNHLRSAYGECNPRNPEYFGTDWPEVYANDIFVDGTGNCFSYAAAFAYLAKAVGYSECYACSSGGHGWSEIDGLVYDAEWSMHNFNYSYYALSYDTRTDVPYKAALSLSSSYGHIKV